MIYLDNGATTRVCDAAVKAAVEAMTEVFGNPSSLHGLGIEAERRVRAARESVADALGCDRDLVFFTSGGTEGNNIAVLGTAEAGARRGKHCVTTLVEHPSVLEAFKKLEADGWQVSYIKPDGRGYISPEAVAEQVREDTVLVSVMCVNNEVGAVEPIAEICRCVREKNKNTVIHTDGVQAFLKLPYKLCESGADIITVSGHKVHAPKGVGAIYIKKGIKTSPRVYGGGQEKGMRSGTEGVPAICAFGAACAEWKGEEAKRIEVMERVRNIIIDGLSSIPGVTLIPGSAAPHILSVSVGAYPSEVVMRMLEQREIYVSSGSACSKGKRSHVLRAMGVNDKVIDSAIRISLCHSTSEDDGRMLIEAINEICKRR